ncbi:hypothetical protein TeGR_g9453, partial [Tetraparma gracilis]
MPSSNRSHILSLEEQVRVLSASVRSLTASSPPPPSSSAEASLLRSRLSRSEATLLVQQRTAARYKEACARLRGENAALLAE